jgi:hypothetical protein
MRSISQWTVLEVNPVVGVRLQALERVVAELLGERFHGYIPPTVSVPLGYVMPEGRYRPWLFGRDAPAVDAAARNDRASLSAVVNSMADGRAGIAAEQLAFRRPAGYLLLGERGRAHAEVSDSLERLGDRGDLAARRFRRFASAFEERLADVG